MSCLYTKVRSDNPRLKKPTVKVVFDLIEAKNSSGEMALHLIARDQRTGSYIYLAEARENTDEWVVKDSEFFDRIYLFVNHVLQFLEYENKQLGVEKIGLILRETATKEFLQIMQLQEGE